MFVAKLQPQDREFVKWYSKGYIMDEFDEIIEGTFTTYFKLEQLHALNRGVL